MRQRYFLPSGVHTKPNPKKKANLGLSLGLGLVFWLVLGFVLLVYSAGQKISLARFSGRTRSYLVLEWRCVLRRALGVCSLCFALY